MGGVQTQIWGFTTHPSPASLSSGAQLSREAPALRTPGTAPLPPAHLGAPPIPPRPAGSAHAGSPRDYSGRQGGGAGSHPSLTDVPIVVVVLLHVQQYVPGHHWHGFPPRRAACKLARSWGSRGAGAAVCRGPPSRDWGAERCSAPRGGELRGGALSMPSGRAAPPPALPCFYGLAGGSGESGEEPAGAPCVGRPSARRLAGARVREGGSGEPPARPPRALPRSYMVTFGGCKGGRAAGPCSVVQGVWGLLEGARTVNHSDPKVGGRTEARGLTLDPSH